MKKMMMLAMMGLLGTAGAAGGTVTGNVQFEADVLNVCRLNTSTFSGSADLPSPFDYKATGKDQGATALFDAYTIRCTAGTKMDISATPPGGPTNSTSIGASDTTKSLSGAMNLSGPGLPLAGLYNVSFTKTPSSSSTTPDTYAGSAGFTATDGQWGVSKGLYTGTLVVTLSYDE